MNFGEILKASLTMDQMTEYIKKNCAGLRVTAKYKDEALAALRKRTMGMATIFVIAIIGLMAIMDRMGMRSLLPIGVIILAGFLLCLAWYSETGYVFSVGLSDKAENRHAEWIQLMSVLTALGTVFALPFAKNEVSGLMLSFGIALMIYMLMCFFCLCIVKASYDKGKKQRAEESVGPSEKEQLEGYKDREREKKRIYKKGR